MAEVIGGITSSHIPAVGNAISEGENTGAVLEAFL